MIDEKKLQQFLQKIIGDFGAAMSVPLVRIGIRGIGQRRAKLVALADEVIE